MNTVFESAYHKIKLILTGWDEPNNGRMLHTADLYINEKLKTNKYFDKWNRLDWNLENYMFESNDGKFVYIPKEGGGFLIETSSFRKIDLPYKALSTITFLKNEFIGNILRIIHTDKTITIQLENLQ